MSYDVVWAGSDKPALRTAIVEFVAKAIDKPGRMFGPCKALAVTRGGKPQAGVILHDWNPEARTIEISAAALAGAFITRRLLRTLSEYIFGQIDCQAIVMRVSERNAPARTLAEKSGFHGTLVPRLRGEGEGEIIFVLPAEEWRDSRLGLSVEKGIAHGCE